MKQLWVVVLIAACGGGGGDKQTMPKNGGTTGGDAGVPALFAAMFVDGKRFTYDVETRTSHWDDTDPKADANGNVNDVAKDRMTCTVRGMQNFTSAVAVRLECDREDDYAPAGVYVATPSGLWRIYAFPMDDAEIAKLGVEDMLLPSAPTAMEKKDEDPEGEGGSIVAIAEKDGAWCKSESGWGGDEAGSSVCFAAGKGLVSGSSYFAGGMVRETTFQLVP